MKNANPTPPASGGLPQTFTATAGDLAGHEASQPESGALHPMVAALSQQEAATATAHTTAAPAAPASPVVGQPAQAARPRLHVQGLQVADYDALLGDDVKVFEPNVTLMVTTHFSSTEFCGLKDALRSVVVPQGPGQVEYNLYQPLFKPAANKANQAPQGLVRASLEKIVAAVNRLATRQVTLIGQEVSILNGLRSFAQALAAEVSSSFMLTPGSVVATIAEEEGTFDLSFGDLVNVQTWVAASDEGLTSTHIVVNINLQVGSLYDAADPFAQIVRYNNSLAAFADKSGLVAPIILGVAFNPNILVVDSLRDTFGSLYEGFSLVPLDSINELDWLPQTTDEAVEKLYQHGDSLLFIRSATPFELAADAE